MARSRFFSALVALLFLCTACGKGASVHPCQGEQDAVPGDGKVQTISIRQILDETAGGVLQGASPVGGNRPGHVILLLDYSGSMYPGYGQPAVTGCDKCVAGLGETGKPVRKVGNKTQPYYFAMPEFRDLVIQWLAASSPPGTSRKLEVLLFNRRLWQLSPGGVKPFDDPGQLAFGCSFSRESMRGVVSLLEKIPPDPFAVDREAPTTTESAAALARTVEAMQGLGEGIVWLLTDNIVDTEGGIVSRDDARRNLDFYEKLKSEPRLQMIMAYPLHQDQPCGWMCGTSLFMYGFYVSRYTRPTLDEIHRIGGVGENTGGPTSEGLLWNGELQKLSAQYSGKVREGKPAKLAGVPLRLKPVDTDVISLEFVLHKGQAIACNQQAEFGDELLCRSEIKIKNILQHQVVEQADLVLTNGIMLPVGEAERTRLPWASAICREKMRIVRWETAGGTKSTDSSSIRLGPIGPLQETTVRVTFTLPAVQVGFENARQLLEVATSNKIHLVGHISATARNVVSRLFVDPRHLHDVYGAPELPQIFKGFEQSSIQTEYPASAMVGNDGQLLGLLILALAIVLGLLAALIIMRFQSIQYTVLVDGVENARVSMPRISRRRIDVTAGTLAFLMRGWGRSISLKPSSGYTVRRSGNSWLLFSSRMTEGDSIRVDVRQGWSKPKSRKDAGSSDRGF